MKCFHSFDGLVNKNVEKEKKVISFSEHVHCSSPENALTAQLSSILQCSKKHLQTVRS